MRRLEKAALGIGCAVTLACSFSVSTGPKADGAKPQAHASGYDPTPAEQLEDEQDRRAAIERGKNKAGGAIATGNARPRQEEPKPGQSDAQRAAESARVKEFYDRLASEQRATNERVAQETAAAAADVSAQKQADQLKEDSCRAEYTALVSAENEKAGWHPPEQAATSTSCSTGMPSGTYKYVGSSGHVTISVDADGCATYEAGQQRSWKRTRVVEDDRLGDRRVEYTKTVYCEVSGKASGRPSVKAQPTKFSDASMCFDGILAKDKAWIVSRGATPQISVTLTGGTRVAARRVSEVPETVQPPVTVGASAQLEMFSLITGDAHAKSEAMSWCAKLQRWNSGERALSNAHGYE